MRLPQRYLFGSFLARFAEEGMSVAMALLALQRTGSVGQAAALAAAWLAPHVVAAPVIGSLASRSRRPTRFYAVCLAGVATAMGTVTTLLGVAPLWLVCLIAVAGGSCGPVVSGGLSSLVAELVPSEHRDRAYAWDSATYNAASIAGIGAATAIATLVGAVTAGWTLAGAAAIATVLIGLLPSGGEPVAAVGHRDETAPSAAHRAATGAVASGGDAVADPRAPGSPAARPETDSAKPPGSTLHADIAVGLAALWREPTLRAVTAATCLAYLGIGALTITAVLTARGWGDGDGGGLLVTAFSLGALLGALALTRWNPPVPPQRLAAYSLLVTGVALGTAAFAPGLGLGLALFALAGAGDGPLLSATLRVRAAHAPAGARAQVFTTGAALKLSAAALGAGLAGLFESLPSAVPLSLIAATQLAAAIVVYALAPRRSRVVAA